MKKSTLFSLFVLLVLIPATLFLGTKLTGRAYYITSTLIILETMLPFFFAFESRKPQARELVLISVLCALAVAARVLVQIPGFKPIIGIIMIAGIALGSEAGFLTGAVAAFASNFFFSQGPWTPWQMMAYGVAGFLAGLLFHKRRPFPDKPWLSAVTLAAYGFVSVVFLVGPLLDTCSIFTVSAKITWKFVKTVYTVGFVPNVILGSATAATLFLVGKPLLGKLDRLILKYGMMEDA